MDRWRHRFLRRPHDPHNCQNKARSSGFPSGFSKRCQPSSAQIPAQSRRRGAILPSRAIFHITAQSIQNPDRPRMARIAAPAVGRPQRLQGPKGVCRAVPEPPLAPFGRLRRRPDTNWHVDVQRRGAWAGPLDGQRPAALFFPSPLGAGWSAPLQVPRVE